MVHFVAARGDDFTGHSIDGYGYWRNDRGVRRLVRKREMIQALIPIVGELAGGWLKKVRQRRRQHRVSSRLRAEAEAEVMRVAATHEAGWERVMAEASKDSWKDEAWTILFIVIIAMCFIPPLQPVCGAWLYCAGDNAELVSMGDVRLNSRELWFARTERIEEVNVEKLITALEVDEGCKFEIYNDHLGYATFGIGHLVTQDDPEFGQPLGTPVSEERVREAFEKDVDRVRLDCLKLYPDFNDLPKMLNLSSPT